MRCRLFSALPPVQFLIFQLIRSHNLVDGILENYENAFSIILPGVTQIGVLARADGNSVAAMNLREWALTPDGTCFAYFSSST
jgi:hypothetical protein